MASVRSEPISRPSTPRVDVAAILAGAQAHREKCREAKVAAQVLRQCEEALELLPPAEQLARASAPPKDEEEEAVGALAGSPEDVADAARRRLAARVLLGERNVLETCVAVWKQQADTTAATAA